MVSYRCDKCGKEYDWYETIYEDPDINALSGRERYNALKKYREETGFSAIGFTANCLKFMFFEPANTNYSTNKGSIRADIEECMEGNNELIMLCPDCMHKFMSSLQNFWGSI